MTAEAAVIGGLLLDGAAIGAVATIVSTDDIASARWREVYGSMLALHARGLAVDYVTVCDELEARGTLDDVKEYHLTEAINLCPTSLYLLDYARTVARRSAERRTRARPAGRGLAI